MLKAKAFSKTAKEILARIDQRQKVLKNAGEKYSGRAVSLAATGSPDTIRSIRRGIAEGTQTGISTETLRKLAFPLRTTTQFLLNGSGSADVDEVDGSHIESDAIMLAGGEHATVPVAGYVSAGAQAVFIPLPAGELDRVAAPPNATAQTIALEIRGESLGEMFDRWLVFYDEVRSPITPDMIGKVCVVGLPDGRILVKKVKRARDGLYDLLSSNEEPLRNVVIDWAARVTHMGPR